MLRRGGGEGGPLGVNGDRREGKQGFQRSVWGVAYVHFGNLSTYLGTQPYLLNKPSHLFLGGGGEGEREKKKIKTYLPICLTTRDGKNNEFIYCPLSIFFQSPAFCYLLYLITFPPPPKNFFFGFLVFWFFGFYFVVFLFCFYFPGKKKRVVKMEKRNMYVRLVLDTEV